MNINNDSLKKFLGNAPLIKNIEQELNIPVFMDMHVGALFAFHLFLFFFWETMPYNLKRHIHTRLYTSKQKSRFLFRPSRRASTQTPNGRTLLIISSTLGFMEPLVNVLGKSRVWFTGKSAYSTGDQFTPLEKLNAEEYETWISEIKLTEKQWESRFRIIVRKFKLNDYYIGYFRALLFMQTQKLVYYFHLLKKMQPIAVITENDRYQDNIPVILAAKKLGIPTFTMIHGSTYPPVDFYPVQADYLLCWGNLQFEQFKKLGTPEGKMLIVGNQRLNKKQTLPEERIRIKQSLGINENDFVCVLATNYIEIQQRLILVETFAEGIKKSGKNIRGIIKPHPQEPKDTYYNIIQKYSQILLLGPRELSNEEVLAISDITVTHNSTYAFDSLINNIPSLILDVITTKTEFGGILCEAGAALNCRSADELSNNILAIKNNSAFRDQLQQNAAAFERQFCSAFATEAAENICRQVSMLSKKEKIS